MRDRARSRPEEWTKDRARCQQAGSPDEPRFVTTPALAKALRPPARAAGGPATGVTGDSVSGADRRRRRWLEAQPWAAVLAVSGTEEVGLDDRPRQVKTILATLPAAGWSRLSAGQGEKGPRWDAWCWLPLADPIAPKWRRWRLVRRRLSDPGERWAAVGCAPQDPIVEAVVRGAGSRWTVERCFDAAKSEVGRDHDEVRRWTGWSRHLTLARWA